MTLKITNHKQIIIVRMDSQLMFQLLAENRMKKSIKKKIQINKRNKNYKECLLMSWAMKLSHI